MQQQQGCSGAVCAANSAVWPAPPPKGPTSWALGRPASPHGAPTSGGGGGAGPMCCGAKGHWAQTPSCLASAAQQQSRQWGPQFGFWHTPRWGQARLGGRARPRTPRGGGHGVCALGQAEWCLVWVLGGVTRQLQVGATPRVFGVWGSFIVFIVFAHDQQTWSAQIRGKSMGCGLGQTE